MEKIIIDSCLTFYFRQYLKKISQIKNIDFKKLLNGLSNDKIKQDIINEINGDYKFKMTYQQSLQNNVIFKEIEKLIPNEFSTENNKYVKSELTFDKKVKLYEKYYLYLKKKYSNSQLLNNPYYYSKNEKEITLYKKLNLCFNYLSQDLNNYKYLETLSNGMSLEFSNAVNVSLFLKDALEGKVELCVSSDSFIEILNHTKGESLNPDVRMIFENGNEVELLMKGLGITLLTTRSKQVENMLNDLSDLYQKEPENRVINGKIMRPMKPEKGINSLGVVGDPKIAAWASLTGINLISTNLKDYISYNADGLDTEIRNYIDFINDFLAKRTGYTTTASVYSPTEREEGKIPEVSPSQKLVVVDRTQKSQYKDGKYFDYFENVMEMG